MSKRLRIMVVICIIVATVAFFGGMMYQYEDYKPIVEYDVEQDKYYIKFIMPLDSATAFLWLDWAGKVHQGWIRLGETAGFEGVMTLEFHQASIDKYNLIKTIFAEFEEEWGEE